MAQLKRIKPTTIFVSLALCFGIIAAIIMPVASAPDETYHFNNSFNIFFENEAMTKNLSKTSSQQTLLGAKDLFAIRNTNIAGSADDLYKTSLTRKVTQLKHSRLRLSLNRQNLIHLPQALGILIAYFIYPSYGLMFIFGRLCNLFFYTGLIYVAIKKSAFGKLPIALIALLPISIQQAASLSYDTSLFASVFLVFSLMTNIWKNNFKISRKWWLYLPLILLGLYLTKKSALIMLALIFTVPVTFFRNQKLKKALEAVWNFCNKYKWLVGVGMIMGSFLVFRFLFTNYGGFMRWLHIMFNTYFVTWINTNLDPIVVSGMVGSFGALTYRLPEWLIILTFVVMSWIMLSDEKIKLDNRVVFISSCIFIFNILITGTMMYKGWTGGVGNVSIGEQGRYYTPFLIFLLPLFMKLSESIKLEIKPWHREVLTFTISFINLFLFVVLTVLFWFTKG